MKFFVLTFLLFFKADLFAQLDSLKKIELWATYYYIPEFENSEKGIDLLNVSGDTTGFKLSSEEWCAAAIEGTVLIKKDSSHYLFNYAGRSSLLQYDCRLCSKFKNYSGYKETGKVLWAMSKGFGKGVNNFNLIPYKTIAADPSVIPIGSVIYIKEAVGIKYKNEKGQAVVHNGYFFAGDQGSGIEGNHIDVFIGYSSVNPFSFVKSNNRAMFEAVIIKDTNVIEQLLIMHR